MSNNNTPMKASVVEEYKGSDGETKTYWTDVGMAFPHKDGKGYNLVIRKGLSVSGELVLRDRQPNEGVGDEGGAGKAGTFPEK